MIYERINPDSPWLTRAMVEILNEWLKPSDIGLEWGSGRSTDWFAIRVAHLISVEHNPEWSEIVKEKLCTRGLIHRVDYKFLPDGKEGKRDSDYVNVAQSIKPNTLDFCLIDGVSRDHCALACLEKLKPGGILIIDNVNWYIPRNPKSRSPNSRAPEDGFASEEWNKLIGIIKNWRCIWFTSGIADTAIWIKESS